MSDLPPAPPPGWQQQPGWQQPPGAPPPGYQPYGGWQPGQMPGWGGPIQRDHPRTVVVLVLGILSLVLGLSCYGLGLLLGPVAWALGQAAISEIDAAPQEYRNRGLVNAGRICGIVATGLLVLAVVIVVIAVIAANS